MVLMGERGIGPWDAVLAAINLVQVVMLAWIASRGSRRRRSDERNGNGRSKRQAKEAE